MNARGGAGRAEKTAMPGGERGSVLPALTRGQVGVVFVVALVSLLLSFLFERLFGALVPLDPEAIRAWLRGWGAWAPVIYISLMVLAIVLTPLPSVPLDIAAGLAFGLFWGTVYTLVGAELGALLAFGLARRWARGWVVRRLGERRAATVDALTHRGGGRAVFLMRLLPAFNFDWVSYAAGLTALPLRTFAVATFLGMIPPVIAIVAVGATLVEDPARARLIFGMLLLAWGLPFVWWLRPRSG